MQITLCYALWRVSAQWMCLKMEKAPFIMASSSEFYSYPHMCTFTLRRSNSHLSFYKSQHATSAQNLSISSADNPIFKILDECQLEHFDLDSFDVCAAYGWLSIKKCTYQTVHAQNIRRSGTILFSAERWENSDKWTVLHKVRRPAMVTQGIGLFAAHVKQRRSRLVFGLMNVDGSPGTAYLLPNNVISAEGRR